MSLVLIVVGQPAIRELLITWISRDGYETAQAANAAAALDEMMARRADVVFCDAQIREQGEFSLAAELHERFPDTAIILATGVSDVPPVISLQRGVVVYLAMTFGREAVLKAVHIGFQWHRMSTDVRAKKADRPDSIFIISGAGREHLTRVSDFRVRWERNGPAPRVPTRSGQSEVSR